MCKVSDEINDVNGDGVNRGYQIHGLHTLRKSLKVLGNRAIDGRTTAGKALVHWRQDLVEDLGGADVISTQQGALVDLAVKSKLLLDSIDAWLLSQKTLINTKKKALLPVVVQRQTLADGLARYLSQLGLERRARPAKSLEDILTQPEKTTTGQGKPTNGTGQVGTTT